MSTITGASGVLDVGTWASGVLDVGIGASGIAPKFISLPHLVVKIVPDIVTNKSVNMKRGRLHGFRLCRRWLKGNKDLVLPIGRYEICRGLVVWTI